MEIIVDVGINHNGNVHQAKELVRQAAHNGADVIKFQSYNVDSIFGENGTDPNPEIYEMVKPLELSRDQLADLKCYVESYDKEFMCSVFDEERLKWMEDLGVKRHKIASRVSKLDMGLATKIAWTGKECLMSLGFGSSRFIDYHDNVKYLYCKSEYPAYAEDLKDMPEKFGSEWYGASLHYLGPSAALLAAARGARVLEMHFTLNKLDGTHPDHICSIDPGELRDLSKYAKEIERLIY